MRYSTDAQRSGQAIALILFALVVLLAALLWNADVHTLVTRKTRTQNAGDASALAAARWQANTLNLIGQLNLLHVQALDSRDNASAEAITSLQARVAFAGPIAAFEAANSAAKVNGIGANPELSAFVREHARKAREYGETAGGKPAIPEPFPNAWREYSDVLADIASRGVAAAPDNARLYLDRPENHILLQKEFYESVEARDWCWFYIFHGAGGDRTILDVFTGHDWFDPLPEPDPPLPFNPEFFGVGIEPRTVRLGSNTLLADYLRSRVRANTNSLDAIENWYFLSASIWGDHWPRMSEDDVDALPLAGPVRPEYDYSGADAVIRLGATARLLSFGDGNGGRREVVWTAAARPFGFLFGDYGERLRPNAYGLVLPAFRDVRLIPLDAASAGTGGDFDLGWRRHCREHVPDYLENGRAGLDRECRWDRLILLFEEPSFRAEGSEWLRLHSHTCSPRMYGTRRGGGTRRGH